MARKRKDTENGSTIDIAAPGRNDDLTRFVSRLEALDEVAEERDRMMAVLGMLADMPLGQAAAARGAKA